MSAGRYSILMEQGATFLLPLVFEGSDGNPIDLTTYTARLQVRQRAGAPLILEMTTENYAIELGGELGTIDLMLSAEDTAALPAGEYFYDLELENGGVVIRLVEGQFTIRAEVTR